MIGQYQAVDLLLGKHRIPEWVEPPKPGWYVYAPDTVTLFPGGKAGVMTADPDEASDLAEFIAAFSKYGTFIHEAWLHTHDVVYGNLTEHPHWTPR